MSLSAFEIVASYDTEHRSLYDSIVTSFTNSGINIHSDADTLSFEQIDDWCKFQSNYHDMMSSYDRLNIDQMNFVDRCIEHANKDSDVNASGIIFATGPGGSGKSEALRVMKAYMKWRHMAINAYNNRGSNRIIDCIITYVNQLHENTILTTAPTGIAAASIDGNTYHSALGFGLGYDPANKKSFEEFILECMITPKNKVKPLLYKLQNTVRTIIIDEVSMVSAYTMDMIDRYLQHIKILDTKPDKRYKPLKFNHNKHVVHFGGIQIILLGDLCQLKPVVNDTDENSKNTPSKLDKIFIKRMHEPFYLADVFNQNRNHTPHNIPNLVHINDKYDNTKLYPIIFTKCYRYDNDPAWGEALKHIRYGEIPNDILNNISKPDRFPKMTKYIDDRLILAFDRARCKIINKSRHYELANANAFESRHPIIILNEEDCDQKCKCEKITKSYNIAANLPLTIGSKVMITKNMILDNVEDYNIQNALVCNQYKGDKKISVVNGKFGTVIGIADYRSNKIAYDQDHHTKVIDYHKRIKSDVIIVRLDKSPINVRICRIPFEESLCDYAPVNTDLITDNTTSIDLHDQIRSYDDRLINYPLKMALVVDAKDTNKYIGIVDTIDYNNKTFHMDIKCFNSKATLSHISGAYKFRARRTTTIKHKLFTYIPLRLAWAITIHKSQGQTIDSIYAFKNTKSTIDHTHGNLYVLLSRVKTLDGILFAFKRGKGTADYGYSGIHVNDIRRNILKDWCVCDPHIKQFYEELEAFYADPDHCATEPFVISDDLYNKSKYIIMAK